MTRTEALITAKARLKDYLKDHGWREGGDCPVCGHRGCFSVTADGYRWTCFSAQHDGVKHGDIFDLYAAMNGLSDGKAGGVLEAVYSELGLTVEAVKVGKSGNVSKEEVEKMAEINAVEETAKADKDRAAAKLAEERRKFIEDAAQRIETPLAKEYLDRRGISLKVAKEYGLGFCEDWRSPAAIRKGKTPPASPRLIIPNDEGGYLARDTRKVMPSEADRFAKQKEGSSSTFGLMRINGADTRPVFVVEGELDALSIIEAGGSAVGLGSVAYVGKFISGLNLLRSKAKDGKKFRPQFIIALDGDEAGEKASRELTSLLSANGYEFRLADPAKLYGKQKDANAALTADREKFKAEVSSFLQATEEELEIARKIKEDQYRQTESAAGSYTDFNTALETERAAVSSGFPSLDNAVSGWKNGGLPVGLYVLGAISSLGKTTFMLQIADQMAAAGNDVLIFSLEMSRLELIGKSISRLTRMKGRTKNLSGLALDDVSYTWGDIRDMSKKLALGLFDLTDKAAVGEAAEEYFSSIGKRVFIYEGDLEGTTIEKIKERIKRHEEMTGKAPVVFVDYLQMIAAPENMATATDKTLTDYKVRACKVMSRDFNTPVIVISSLNRESYYKPMALTSFKESGSIEYTADVVLGLQYPDMEKIGGGEGAEAKGKKIEADMKSQAVRDIEVKLLKNRSGGMSERPLFKFYAPYNFFKEEDRQSGT